uniref:Uncharacterized protein n=1 Tax=Globisporangium ultimum (strain ATCC 200006 / CBS 805.95 / DAOM BR144) TaxID=431595 RepID=K3W6T3_GLOUD
MVAVLAATYQLYRLEATRTRGIVQVEEEFERAVRFLQGQLPSAGKYEVRLTRSANGKHQAAIVINRGYDVPHIEAELLVDQHLVAVRRQMGAKSKPKRQSSARPGAAKPAPAFPPALRFRVYDHATMDAIAQTLYKNQMIDSYDPK